jgi:hypothetical protein
MKVLHCILLVLMFGFSSVGMAQKINFVPTSVSIFQGGQEAYVRITGTPDMKLSIISQSKNLEILGYQSSKSEWNYSISATKKAILGANFVKFKGEYKKKFVFGTINVNVLRPNHDPVINLFTVDKKIAIQGDEVKFTTSVSDRDSDVLTCYLDVDGDGKSDFTKQKCSEWNQTYIYNKGGNFHPSITVQDAFGGKKTTGNLEILRYQQNQGLIIEPLGQNLFVNTVSDSQDILSGDGKCIDENQKCSLRAAIMELNSAKGVGSIQIPAGKYQFALDGEDETSQRGDLDIIGKIRITGEGSDTTIIDANKKDRIFNVQVGGQLWVSNMSLINGSTKNNEDGGAILVKNDRENNFLLEILNVNITGNNSNGGKGGGIAANNFLVSNSNFTYNLANTGGAISGVGTIQNSNFENNTTNSGGGAILSSNIIIKKTKINNNKSINGYGGGVYIEISGKSIIENTSITKNEANSYGGGGIFLERSKLELKNSLIDHNFAKFAGGIGVISYDSDASIISSVISNNTASEMVGGIYGDGKLTIWYSSIVGNKSIKAGGLYTVGDQRKDSFKANLFADNIAESGPDCFGSISSSGYNLVQNPKDCRFVAAHRDSAGKVTDHVAENPQLQSIVDSYFGTLFTPSNPVLINAIPKADCTLPDGTPLETDMLGKPRLQGSGCDIGAIEVR